MTGRSPVLVFLLAALIGGLLGSYPRVAQADINVNVSATVVGTTEPLPNPSVHFQGIAAPYGRVAITRDAQTPLTMSTVADAVFDVSLSNEPVGQHVYKISGTDRDGLSLAPLTVSLNLTSGSATFITGLFLGPSITIDKTSVKLGQFVTVSGSTAPDSDLTISVNSVKALSFSVTANPAGRWSKMINTQDVGVGTHTVKARAVSGGTNISEFSQTVSFAVNPLGQCDGKKTADLNCDGRVNLTDFSILLFFWQQRNPANARADINADGQVTIVDFSIMLFQWTA